MRRCRASISGTAVSVLAYLSPVRDVACRFTTSLYICFVDSKKVFIRGFRWSARFISLPVNKRCMFEVIVLEIKLRQLGVSALIRNAVSVLEEWDWVPRIQPPLRDINPGSGPSRLCHPIRMGVLLCWCSEFSFFSRLPIFTWVARLLTWGEVAPLSGTLSWGGTSFWC